MFGAQVLVLAKLPTLIRIDMTLATVRTRLNCRTYLLFLSCRFFIVRFLRTILAFLGTILLMVLLSVQWLEALAEWPTSTISIVLDQGQDEVVEESEDEDFPYDSWESVTAV